MMTRNIAERLKYARKHARRQDRDKAGYSQEEAGELLGVKRMAISKQEDFSNWQKQNFDRPYLSTQEVIRRAELYQSDTDWIYFGDSKIPDEKVLNVIVVDDDPAQLFRARLVVSCITDYVVTFPFQTARETMAWLETNRPDIAIVDYKLYDPSLPDDEQIDGIDIVQALQMRYPDIPKLIITSYADNALEQFEKNYDMITVVWKPYRGNFLFELCRHRLMGLKYP